MLLRIYCRMVNSNTLINQKSGSQINVCSVESDRDYDNDLLGCWKIYSKTKTNIIYFSN